MLEDRRYLACRIVISDMFNLIPQWNEKEKVYSTNGLAFYCLQNLVYLWCKSGPCLGW